MEMSPHWAGWFAAFAAMGTASLARAQGVETTESPIDASTGDVDTARTTEPRVETPTDNADTVDTTDPPDETSPRDSVTDATTAHDGASDIANASSVTPESSSRETRSDSRQGNETKDDKGKKNPWDNKSKTKVRGLLRALWLLQDTNDEPTHEFRVASARIELDWRHAKLLEATVELDAAQDIRSSTAWSMLRDAYVRVKPLPELRFRLGQFKKPFSRLELRSRRKLRLIDRGITNAWIVEDLGYGDRDIGFQVEGRFGEQTNLSYQVGAFDGSGINSREADLDGSKDLVARLELDHAGWLSVGASGSHQRFDQSVTPQLPRSGTMGEVDFRLQIGRLRVLGEGMYGENQLSIDRAESWSALLLASYKIPLTTTWRMALEPVAKVEVLKIEHHVRDAHIWSATAGVNYHLARYFRFMVQGDWIRPSANTLDLWVESHRLSAQVIVDLR